MNMQCGHAMITTRSLLEGAQGDLFFKTPGSLQREAPPLEHLTALLGGPRRDHTKSKTMTRRGMARLPLVVPNIVELDF